MAGPAAEAHSSSTPKTDSARSVLRTARQLKQACLEAVKQRGANRAAVRLRRRATAAEPLQRRWLNAFGQCRATIAATVLELGDFDRAERATGGFDTTVWHVQRGGREYALRVFRSTEAHVLRRELLALRAARVGGIPVPRVHAVGTYVDARPAMLLEWCRGSMLLSRLEARPAEVARLGYRFGHVQRRIHGIAAPTALRSIWIDWPAPAEPRLKTRLEAVAAPRMMLMHMDFHPLNVLVDDGRVSAVLDWVNAHGGEPRADVARTLTILRLSPPLGGRKERLLRRALELSWRAGYGRLGDEMPVFYAWAGAVMLQDLRERFSAHELEHVRRWTTYWRRRGGL